MSVIEFLKDNNPAGCSAFSIDVEDLYYSMPHDELMMSVKECIFERNDEMRFRTKSGTSAEGFLELLSFYLKSTFVGWQDNVYVQKSGVCIGSRVAPMLSSIFLGKVDRALERRLAENTEQIFRYVDDYLVFIEKTAFNSTVNDVLRSFAEEGLGLRFTSETPKEYKIQFLDLLVDVKEDHVCWMHHPRTTKTLLDYRSAHSKLVKNGIAFSCLQSALTKSCSHKMKVSFLAQVARLRDSNFPDSVITSACDRLIRSIKVDPKRPHKEKTNVDKTNVAAFLMG
ncbi:unnamed protein product [Ixodes hexagonus]